MYTKTLIFALAVSPFVAAHGKVAVVSGSGGGNGTAIGIQGGIIPGPGKNSVTEKDTTVFSKKQAGTDPKSDGLGRTTGQGPNTLAMLTQSMAQSGDTLPQIPASGGTLSGTYHIVTTDGAGPITAVLDTTGTGKFSQGTVLDTITQVPGNGGNIKATRTKRDNFIAELWERSLDALEARGLMKRAQNVNTDHPMAFAVPAGTQCTGEMAGMKNVCLVKIANQNRAGPFGGVVAVQVGADGTATPAAPAAAPATKKVSKRFSA